MLQIDRILFPVDFSDRCTAAAPHVVAMAGHFHAKVLVLHVLTLPPLWYGEVAAGELEALVNSDQLVGALKVKLSAYLREELQPVEGLERVVATGDPAGVITDYARQNGVKLIMAPTHGYGPFRRLLLGSVAAKVLHDAECPVWTDVHAEASLTPRACRSVICAVDLREESAAAIRWAADFAESHGAELTLVHAIPALSGPVPRGEGRFRSHLAVHAHEYMADLQRQAGTSARISIGGGRIAETVRDAAIQQEADVVVIGQGCLHETLGKLRSNAYAIIRQSPCPVVRV
jgi:nucleotide-binding universal stress UspA family protein